MAGDHDVGPDKKKGEVPVREAADLERELTTRDTQREDERERRERERGKPPSGEGERQD